MGIMSMQRTSNSVRGMMPPWLGLDRMTGKVTVPSAHLCASQIVKALENAPATTQFRDYITVAMGNEAA